MILEYIASSKTALIICTHCKLGSDLSSVGTVWTHPSSRSCSANSRLIRFVRFCVLPKHTQTRQVVVKVSSDWIILLNINISSLALVGQPATIVPGYLYSSNAAAPALWEQAANPDTPSRVKLASERQPPRMAPNEPSRVQTLTLSDLPLPEDHHLK